MEEKMVSFLKMEIYYGIATMEEPTLEEVIRIFDVAGKDYCEEIMGIMPAEHPAKINFEKISDITFEEFEKIKLEAFAKMSMYEIDKKIADWELLSSDKDIDKFAEDINKYNLHDIENFINSKKEILKAEPYEYEFYFAMLYRYLASKNNNIEFIEREIELLEDVEFYDIYEGYRYLEPLFNEASYQFHNNNEYELAEKYYKNDNELLEECIKKDPHDEEFKTKYATNLHNLGFLYSDMKKYDMAEKELNNAIEVREPIINDYFYSIKKILKSQALSYSELGYVCKLEYKENGNEDLIQKYEGYYKKAIDLYLKIDKMEEDFHQRIKNYNNLANAYFMIFDDESTERTYKRAIKLCKEVGASDLLEEEQNLLEEFYSDKEKYKKEY